MKGIIYGADKTEYRMARPDEGPRILDFINMVFSTAHEPHDFKQLLPKVYDHDDLWKLHYVAVRDGQILATIALLPLTLKPVSGITLKVGYVGSVSVHPYHRSEGHMKKLMYIILDDAKREGYDLLALGGRRQRYGYFGFGKADPVLDYEVEKANVKHALSDADDESIGFEPLSPEMTETLEKISQTYYAGMNTCERGDRLFDHLRGWKAEPDVITDGGRYIGYVCRSGSNVYELGLDEPEAAGRVIKAFVKRFGKMSGRTALYDPRFRKAFTDIAETVSVTDMQMIRVVNWRKVLGAYLAVRNGIRRIPDGSFSFAVKGSGSLRISAQNGVISITDEIENTAECMTPEKAAELFFSVGGAVECEDPWLKELLPLPFHMGTEDHF